VDPFEARARVATARVARLATAAPTGQPHLVPISFALHDNMIVTAIDHKPKRSTNLRRLRNIEANPRVSVLVDHYAEDWSLLWWIRVDGRARVLPDATEAVSWLVAKYDQYRRQPPAGPVIAIDALTWRGWAHG
jgi:PPOX class probable F420-dependent enzyme